MADESFREAVARAEAGQDVPEELMKQAMTALLQEDVPAELAARLLRALAQKGESVGEIVGAAAALREVMVPVRTSRADAVDVVGTGGDRSGTFNVSTAAAIVVAACGVPVAKHGNRSVTSRCGSADVLRELGVNIQPPVEVVEACLEHLGICFCFAPQFHPAMKRVAPIRQQLGFPTIFNLLGPLVNPAQVRYQLLGVGRAEVRPRIAEAIRRLGTRCTWVVHNAEGLDEFGLTGTNFVSESTAEGVREFEISAAELGLPPVRREQITVTDAAESAAVIRQVLAGERSPARYVVLANAAATLKLAGRAQTLAEGVALAETAIDSGRTKNLLEKWIRCSNAPGAEEVQRICDEL